MILILIPNCSLAQSQADKDIYRIISKDGFMSLTVNDSHPPLNDSRKQVGLTTEDSAEGLQSWALLGNHHDEFLVIVSLVNVPLKVPALTIGFDLNLYIGEWNRDAIQQWKLVSSDDGYYQIVSSRVVSSRNVCIERIPARSKTSKGGVRVDQCSDSDLQMWSVKKTSSPDYAGISSDLLPTARSRSSNPQISFVDSVHTILGYLGLEIPPSEIFVQVYRSDDDSDLPDWPTDFDSNWLGSFQMLTNGLDKWTINNKEGRYLISANLSRGAPDASVLFEELSQGYPVLLAIRASSLSKQDKVVILVGATFSPDHRIETVIVRDPSIDSKGLGYPAEFIQSAIAFWQIRIEGSLLLSLTENKLLSVLSKSEIELKREIQKLVPIKRQLPGGSIIEAFRSNDVQRIFQENRRLAIERLEDPALFGMKAYINKFYPIPKLRILAQSFRVFSNPVSIGRFAPEVQSEDLTSASSVAQAINSVLSFFEKLKKNRKSIDLQVLSTPDGANFKLSTQWRPSREIDTNSQITIFRGLYTYTISKTSFNTITRELNLIDDKSTIVDCKLYQGKAGSCSLR